MMHCILSVLIYHVVFFLWRSLALVHKGAWGMLCYLPSWVMMCNINHMENGLAKKKAKQDFSFSISHLFTEGGGGVSKCTTFPISHSLLLSVELLTLEQWVVVRKVRNQVACQIIIISMVVFSTFPNLKLYKILSKKSYQTWLCRKHKLLSKFLHWCCCFAEITIRFPVIQTSAKK